MKSNRDASSPQSCLTSFSHVCGHVLYKAWRRVSTATAWTAPSLISSVLTQRQSTCTNWFKKPYLRTLCYPGTLTVTCRWCLTTSRRRRRPSVWPSSSARPSYCTSQPAMGCMEGRTESLWPARESRAARASGKRILWRRNLQWCGIQPKELEAAASDRSHWRSLTHTASTNFEDDRPFKDSCSLWTTPPSILCWHHNDGVRVPHLFQTLLFQTGFAEPPENPWMITQHALFFGHEGQPPIANFWALRLRLSKRHEKNHGVALNLEILVDNSIPESIQALKTFPLLILTRWKVSVCLPFTQSFRKIWRESKWNTTFWVVPAENFGKQQNIWKGSLFFRMECSKRKFVFHFFKAIFDISFRLSRPFFGKWNWIV